MTPCPRCIGGSILRDDDRLVCIACGFIAADRSRSLTERLVSRDVIERSRAAQRGRIPVGPSMDALKARVLAAVRAEVPS